MNGVHDIGGTDSVGPINHTLTEPVFSEQWQRDIFGLTIGTLAAGYMNVDEIRRETEKMFAKDYLSASYFQKWVYCLEQLLIEKDVVTEEELQSGKSIRTDGNVLPAASQETVNFLMTAPMPSRQEMDTKPLFNVGDEVITKNMHPMHHTRIPRYARGKRGTVIQYHGGFMLPDTNAYCNGHCEHNYSVKFTAYELWGEGNSKKDCVYLDLFDSYMEHV